MPLHNADVAESFNKIADYLEIEGANPFRIRAYRNTARIIGSLPEDIAEMVGHHEDLSRIRGIGKDLAGKINELVLTGHLPLLDQLEHEVPPDLNTVMKIPGLGGKRVKTLYQRLHIRNVEDLKKAAEEKKIRELPGFGKKTERGILEGIQRLKGGEELTRLDVARQIVRPLIAYLKRSSGVENVVVAGSYRRRKEVVRDIDILASCRGRCDVMGRFIRYEDVERIISHGPARSTVLMRPGIQVDLRVVSEESYGAALLYFTGSKAHNIVLRTMALDRGLKINEYGVFKGDRRLAGRSEDEMYRQVGLPYIEPELRENRGEIEAAREDRLPRLVAPDDIRGDLHVHTSLTDGHNTLEEMVAAAKARGYEYVGITEHSRRVTVAHGLDARRLRERNREIDRLNVHLSGIAVLKGVEVDILEDGSLDLPDEALRELDFTICSVHSKFNLPREQQTERIIRAMDNPFFNILGHPTGRVIKERPPYDVDVERIIEAAHERGCFLELNAHPARLDLGDIYDQLAKDRGTKIAISTDAHSVADLDNMRFGVDQARRGWLGPGDVINTRRLDALRKLLRRT